MHTVSLICVGLSTWCAHCQSDLCRALWCAHCQSDLCRALWCAHCQSDLCRALWCACCQSDLWMCHVTYPATCCASLAGVVCVVPCHLSGDLLCESCRCGVCCAMSPIRRLAVRVLQVWCVLCHVTYPATCCASLAGVVCVVPCHLSGDLLCESCRCGVCCAMSPIRRLAVRVLQVWCVLYHVTYPATCCASLAGVVCVVPCHPSGDLLCESCRCGVCCTMSPIRRLAVRVLQVWCVHVHL